MESTSYNAAASTLSGLGLFITTYIISYVKAKRPQLMFPTIVYAIFTVVASVYAPRFPNMAASESFVKHLLGAFLTGFGIAAGVSFVIFPMTSRMVATKQTASFLELLQLALKSHTSYMTVISPEERRSRKEAVFDHAPLTEQKGTNGHHTHHMFHHKAKAESVKEMDAKLSAEAAAMKGALFQIGALLGKCRSKLVLRSGRSRLESSVRRTFQRLPVISVISFYLS